MLDRGTARGPCRSCKPGRRIPLGGRVHPARSAERAGLTKQPSLYWKSSFPGLADEARAPCPENPGGSLPFPKARRRPFCGAGGFWGADASPICNTRSDFFQGGVLFFLIALCYINKKRVAMSVSPAHSCALFFFVREIGGQGGDSRTWAASPGGRNMRTPCAGAPAWGYPKPHRPFGTAAAGRLWAAEPAKPAGGGFSWQMQAKKRGHAGPAKTAGREGADLRTARGAPAACRLRLCSQNEILCGHDTCEPSQTRYGCGAIACIFVVLREAYVGTGGSYVGTENKQFS